MWGDYRASSKLNRKANSGVEGNKGVRLREGKGTACVRVLRGIFRKARLPRD